MHSVPTKPVQPNAAIKPEHVLITHQHPLPKISAGTTIYTMMVNLLVRV
jgi:hypothetical protein